MYWRFESWLKQREDRLGSTIGLIGEPSAVRAEAWRPIPPDVAIDDLWAGLDIIEQGYRVAYEPRARALDPAAPSLRPSGNADPQRVRRAARPRPAPSAAPPLGGSRRGRAVGAPAGPFHGEPAGPRGAAPGGGVPGAHEPVARAFLVANVVACAGLVAGDRVGEPPGTRRRDRRHATSGSRSRRVLVRSCSSRAWPWEAWSAMHVATGRPCGRLWSDEWHGGAAGPRRGSVAAVRTLMLTKFLPLPDNNGGHQRSLAIARRLADLGDLVLCGYDDGSADRAGLRAHGNRRAGGTLAGHPDQGGPGVAKARSRLGGAILERRMVKAVRGAADEKPIDLLQVEYQQMVPLVLDVPAKQSVLDLHNVESSLVASYAGARRGPPRCTLPR